MLEVTVLRCSTIKIQTNYSEYEPGVFCGRQMSTMKEYRAKWNVEIEVINGKVPVSSAIAYNEYISGDSLEMVESLQYIALDVTME